MSEAFPLSWPLGWKRNATRVDSRFGRYMNRPTVGKGSRLVLEELKRTGVPDHKVIISTNVQLRLDGLPYSNQREPSDPGAAVYFTLKDQKKVLACDKYRTVGENLYAIGKTIEATRAIERWGSVTTEQAFAGYVALQEKTERSCWEVLGLDPQVPQLAREPEGIIIEAYRRRARETHPDNANGSSEAFSEVCRAKDMALQLIKQ
jgi:hypothetical protein